VAAEDDDVDDDIAVEWMKFRRTQAGRTPRAGASASTTAGGRSSVSRRLTRNFSLDRLVETCVDYNNSVDNDEQQPETTRPRYSIATSCLSVL